MYRQLNTQEADNKRAAAISARMASAHNRMTHSDETRRRVLVVQDIMRDAFEYDDLFVTYRKQFATVKVEHARVNCRLALANLNTVVEAYGMSIVQTPQGIIVRIPG